MKKELNIAAILKEKPKGTKLYSKLSGDCFLTSLDDDIYPIQISSSNSGDWHLMENGKYEKDGECLIFPSKEMRDWEKFAWKKGDVLVKDSTCVCVFNEWNNEKYTSIKCKYIKYMDAGSYTEDRVYITDGLRLASQEEKDAYISSIEDYYGGKLNLKTLEIEKTKPELKDGDIVVAECEDYGNYILIFRELVDGDIYDHASLTVESSKLDCSGIYRIDKDEYQEFRPATDSEKQQLFNALANENKVWNPDTKQIEDLPKKCEFEPFQKVLVRMRQNNVWKMALFIEKCKDKSDMRYPYRAFNIEDIINDLYAQCIPYTHETKHLLGTKDEWKGGEL